MPACLLIQNQIIFDLDSCIKKDNETQYLEYINQIINGKPLQYITHEQEFMGFKFYVDENVLIPRPDTEILVEEVIKYCNELRNNESEDKETNKDYKENIEKEPIINKEDKNINKKTIKILDLCTGSGAIAVSLAKYIKNVHICAVDISSKALEIAKKNAELNGVKNNIEFIESNLFDKIKERKFDIIVSNPPYIETETIKTLSKDVQSEPKIALDGGKDGLDFYRKIADSGSKYLNRQGYICLEIGYNQRIAVRQILENKKRYVNINCIKDLCGNDRVITAQIG